MKNFLFIYYLVVSTSLYSQSYSEIMNTDLENKSLSSVTAGDLNNDGYIDMVTTGIDENSELSTSIYINDQDGSFTKLNIPGLTPLYNATIELGDYNNDGYLDILLAGEGYDPLATLWKNNGDLTFTEVSVGLDNLGGTNAEFRDIDNDGDLDILISGSIRQEDGSYLSDLRLYSNEGNDSFTEFELSFSSYAVVGTLGDYDNDGDLDLIIGGGALEIYPNNGDGTFSSPIDLGISFPAGQIHWFDYNNDQKLDFVISGRGFSANEYFTKLFENTGDENELFVEVVNTSFSNPIRQKLDIRDYNSDGYIDLLLTGTLDFATNSFVTQIYDNSGDSFSENSSVNLPQLGSGDGNWFDIDNDGDLDLILSGEEVQGENVKRTVLLRNDDNSNIYSSNTIPDPPSELSWSWSNGITTLMWNEGTDAETSLVELSYNIGLGSTSDAINIIFPESNISTGKRLINRLGNAHNNNQKILRNLDDGIYYFNVQTIDAALQGSGFSQAKKFAVGIPDAPVNFTAELIEKNVTLTWDDIVNETSYILERSKDDIDNYEVISTIEEDILSFTDNELESGNYHYRIKAINENGESNYSSNCSY